MRVITTFEGNTVLIDHLDRTTDPTMRYVIALTVGTVRVLLSYDDAQKVLTALRSGTFELRELIRAGK